MKLDIGDELFLSDGKGSVILRVVPHKGSYKIKEYMESCEDCGFCAKPENTRGLLNTLRSRLHGLSYESSDWSHGEHPRVVELDEIDDLFDEFDE